MSFFAALKERFNKLFFGTSYPTKIDAPIVVKPILEDVSDNLEKGLSKSDKPKPTKKKSTSSKKKKD
jgi:hypothetical protein